MLPCRIRRGDEPMLIVAAVLGWVLVRRDMAKRDR
jgi:hypothetical protein